MRRNHIGDEALIPGIAGVAEAVWPEKQISVPPRVFLAGVGIDGVPKELMHGSSRFSLAGSGARMPPSAVNPASRTLQKAETGKRGPSRRKRDGHETFRDESPKKRDGHETFRDESPTKRDGHETFRDESPTKRDGHETFRDA